MNKDTPQQPTPKEVHLTPEEIGGLVDLESVEDIARGHDAGPLINKFIKEYVIPRGANNEILENWQWSISVGGRYIDMRFTNVDVLPDEFIDIIDNSIEFKPANIAVGIPSLLGAIGERKIVSIRSGKRWLLEIVDKRPKETSNNMTGGQPEDPGARNKRSTVRIVQPDPNIPNSMLFKKKKLDSPPGGSNFALDA